MSYKLSLTTLATCALLALPASAQSQDGQGGGTMAACRADIASLCQNMEAGRGRKLNCLIEHKAKLGAECAAALDARQARIDACRSDMATLCQDVERGSGKRTACLKQNQQKLSPACAAALATMTN